MTEAGDLFRRLPKTDLHCHLDGSLRPATLLELADQEGMELPGRTEAEIRDHLAPPPGADLPAYLTRFRWTVGALQSEEALERAAYELAEDAHRENVWHLEVRYAPFLHLRKGLRAETVVEAVLAGLGRAAATHGIGTGVILCGMRTADPERTVELAELAVRYRDAGVVALDLAGTEKGFPASHHRQAFDLVRQADMNVTIHAGEAFGPASIREAIHECGADRIGHGTRLAEDPRLVRYVDDHRISIEVCLTSNLQTGAVPRLEDHPFPRYLREGIRVHLNTDNRLISGTDSTTELRLAAERFDLGTDDLRRILVHGFKSTFLPRSEKADLLVRAGAELDRLLGPAAGDADPEVGAGGAIGPRAATGAARPSSATG